VVLLVLGEKGDSGNRVRLSEGELIVVNTEEPCYTRESTARRREEIGPVTLMRGGVQSLVIIQ